MCGITGIVNFNGKPVDAEVLRKMNNLLIHRGPDDEGYFIKEASVFVLTSLYEGSPNVLLDAMACGVPVLSVDSAGGVRKIIGDGKNGMIIAPGDINGLAAGIKNILADPALADSFVRSAAEALKKYGLVRMMNSYEKLLSSAKDCSRRKAPEL